MKQTTNQKNKHPKTQTYKMRPQSHIHVERSLRICEHGAVVVVKISTILVQLMQNDAKFICSPV